MHLPEDDPVLAEVRRALDEIRAALPLRPLDADERRACQGRWFATARSWADRIIRDLDLALGEMLRMPDHAARMRAEADLAEALDWAAILLRHQRRELMIALQAERADLYRGCRLVLSSLRALSRSRRLPDAERPALLRTLGVLGPAAGRPRQSGALELERIVPLRGLLPERSESSADLFKEDAP